MAQEEWCGDGRGIAGSRLPMLFPLLFVVKRSRFKKIFRDAYAHRIEDSKRVKEKSVIILPWKHNTKPEPVAPTAARVEGAAVRGTQEFDEEGGVAAPRAPTHNADGSCCRSSRISCRSRRIGPIPVVTPLAHVPRN